MHLLYEKNSLKDYVVIRNADSLILSEKNRLIL